MTDTGPDPETYEQAKRLMISPDPAVRLQLAQRSDLAPELLYYMADDGDPIVRRAVAHNGATPLQAAPRLARDVDADVRILLARRLARALPHLTADEQAALRDIAHNALSMLAIDQVVRVRAALAGALRDVAVAPPGLIASLARDVAREVAEPILRTCVTLPDEELIAIIKAQPVPWVLEAIARRERVSMPVADAVVEQRDRLATATLLANPGARLSDQALAGLVATSLMPGAEGRSLLPPSLVSKMASIVEESIRGEMSAHGFDREDRRDVVAVTQRRLEWARDYVKQEPADQKAARLKAEGRLDEAVIWDALSWGDKSFVREALALKADLSPDLVQRIIDTQSARAITALAWRAGLSMRCARLLQLKSGLPPTKLLNARHGTDYPMSEAELRWQLELFGVE